MSAAPHIEKMILDGLTRPKDRDKQVKVGPSELGGCAYCVGHRMSQLTDEPARPRGDEGFGYAAHIGTMCHYWLEHELRLDYEGIREGKVPVFDIEGYGTISGSCDLYIPELATTFDWKFPGKWSYDKLKLALSRGGEPSLQYRLQQQLYAEGQRKLGRPIERCVIVFFPRHSNNINDVVFWEEAFNPELVAAVKERTETIWLYVQEGQLAEIPSDDDCYTCSTYGR